MASILFGIKPQLLTNEDRPKKNTAKTNKIKITMKAMVVAPLRVT